MIDTTRPANAERLASAVYEALTIDAQDFFERPDGVQVIIVNNGWTLAISDDTGEDAPNGLSWWIDSPEEKGIDSDGWEELPAAHVAGQAASLADYFRHVSTSTIGRVVERLNTIHWDDFGEIEDYIDAKVDRWATLGDPSSGPDECSVLVKIGDDVSLIHWCYGDKFVEQRFAVYSASELAAVLNSCRDQGGGNVSFIIGEACDNARYLREPPVVGWNVTFGDDVSVLKQVDGVWNATPPTRRLRQSVSLAVAHDTGW